MSRVKIARSMSVAARAQSRCSSPIPVSAIHAHAIEHVGYSNDRCETWGVASRHKARIDHVAGYERLPMRQKHQRRRRSQSARLGLTTGCRRRARSAFTLMASLSLTPRGRLLFTAEEGNVQPPAELLRRLKNAFARGSGHGLLELGAAEVGTVLASLRHAARGQHSRWLLRARAVPGRPCTPARCHANTRSPYIPRPPNLGKSAG